MRAKVCGRRHDRGAACLAGAVETETSKKRRRRRAVNTALRHRVRKARSAAYYFFESPEMLLRLGQKPAQSKQRNTSYCRLKKGSRFFLRWSQGKHGSDDQTRAPVPSFKKQKGLAFRGGRLAIP